MSDIQVVEQSEVVRVQVESQVATARMYPRDLAEFSKNLELIACSDVETAASCIYSRPVSDTATATGPSIRLAEMVLQGYQHIMAQTMVVNVGDRTLTAQAKVWDMQNNTHYTAEVTKSIIGRNKQRYSDDMVVVTGQAACAIALRNAIFKVAPWSIIKPVYDKCLLIAGGDPAETKSRFEDAVKAFTKNYKKGEDDLLAFVSRDSVGALTTMDIARLSALWEQLKSGDTTVEEAFQVNQPVDESEPVVEGEAKDDKPNQEKMFDDTAVTDVKPEEAKKPAETKKPKGNLY